MFLTFRGNSTVVKTIESLVSDPKAQQSMLITAKREIEEAESKKKSSRQLIRYDLAVREKIGKITDGGDDAGVEEIQISLDAAICHK
jgi:hypothetical protein